jgi:hypothetical protein
MSSTSAEDTPTQLIAATPPQSPKKRKSERPVDGPVKKRKTAASKFDASVITHKGTKSAPPKVARKLVYTRDARRDAEEDESGEEENADVDVDSQSGTDGGDASGSEAGSEAIEDNGEEEEEEEERRAMKKFGKLTDDSEDEVDDYNAAPLPGNFSLQMLDPAKCQLKNLQWQKVKDYPVMLYATKWGICVDNYTSAAWMCVQTSQMNDNGRYLTFKLFKMLTDDEIDYGLNSMKEARKPKPSGLFAGYTKREDQSQYHQPQTQRQQQTSAGRTTKRPSAVDSSSSKKTSTKPRKTSGDLRPQAVKPQPRKRSWDGQ